MCAQTRPRFLLSSERVFGEWSQPMLTPKEKSPPPENFSSEEDRTHGAASSGTASPTHYQLSFSGPHASDLKTGTPAAQPGTWHYKVRAGTGWPGTSTL